MPERYAEFRAALGHIGHDLDRSDYLDAALARCELTGWDMTQLARRVRLHWPRTTHNPGGLIVARVVEAADRQPPARPGRRRAPEPVQDELPTGPRNPMPADVREFVERQPWAKGRGEADR